MIRAGALAALALAGCTAAPPRVGMESGRTCRADDAARFAGQPATADLGQAILSATGAATLRWVQPGQMVTMDFRADRVTVHLDAGNRVTRVVCG